MVVFTWNSMPTFLKFSMAFITLSNAPSTRRKLLCCSAVRPSIESDTRMMPESFIFCASSSVTKRPQGAMTMRRPSLVPCLAIS